MRSSGRPRQPGLGLLIFQSWLGRQPGWAWPPCVWTGVRALSPIAFTPTWRPTFWLEKLKPQNLCFLLVSLSSPLAPPSQGYVRKSKVRGGGCLSGLTVAPRLPWAREPSGVGRFAEATWPDRLPRGRSQSSATSLWPQEPGSQPTGPSSLRWTLCLQGVCGALRHQPVLPASELSTASPSRGYGATRRQHSLLRPRTLPSLGAPAPGGSHPVFPAPRCQREGKDCSPSLTPAERIWGGRSRLRFADFRV